MDTMKGQLIKYPVEYDTTNPITKLGGFIFDVERMITRYEKNDLRIQEIEEELYDMEHFVEIAPAQNAAKGYKVYHKMADLRRERRARKNENALLRPIYDYFYKAAVLPRLRSMYGEVYKIKQSIDDRKYSVRTKAIDEFFDKPPKEEKVYLNLNTSETFVEEV